MDTLRVMELLQRNAEDPNNAVVKPNTMTYCMAIDSFGKAAYQKATSMTRQKLNRNGSLIQPYSNGDDHLDNDPYKEIAKGESILKYMHDLHNAGNDDVVPNVVAYNTLLTGYARISSETLNDAPMRAEGVLRKMIELSERKIQENFYPDTRSYNAVIQCWANSKQQNAGARSEWWLRRLSSEGGLENIQPDVHTYNYVILAYHNIGQPSKADMLLKELIENEQ